MIPALFTRISSRPQRSTPPPALALRVGPHRLRPLPAEQPRRRPPDAGRRARNQRYLVLQSHLSSYPPVILSEAKNLDYSNCAPSGPPSRRGGASAPPSGR